MENQKTQLPELKLELTAELSGNNLPEFETAFNEAIKTYSYELLTDDDFAKAKEDISTLKETETILSGVKESLLAGSVDLATATAKLDELKEKARVIRLDREKKVKTRDAAIKSEIVSEAITLIDNLSSHTFKAQMEKAIKGKRSYEAMRKACTDLVTSINERIASYRVIIQGYVDQHGEDIASRMTDLELKSTEEVLIAELDKRVAEKAAMRAKIEAEQAQESQRLAEQSATAREQVKETVTEEPRPVRPTAPTPAPANTVTSADEWERFCQRGAEFFAVFREARKTLIHPSNYQAAEIVAAELSTVWSNAKSKGGAQ